MQTIKVKQLNIKPEGNWFKRNFWSKHAKKSLLYITIGAIGGIIYFYFTEGRNMINITAGDIIRSMLFGAFLGFFITNSPCARGKC